MRICLGETDLVREADFSEDVVAELRAQKLYKLTRQVRGGGEGHSRLREDMYKGPVAEEYLAVQGSVSQRTHGGKRDWKGC